MCAQVYARDAGSARASAEVAHRSKRTEIYSLAHCYTRWQRSWTRTVLRTSGGGGCASSSSCLRSAEGFGVQHAEVQETGGEPASAEWFGRRIIGNCGAAVWQRSSLRLTFCTIRTTMGSLTSAVEALWKFGLAGGRSVTMSASRHRSTDLICIYLYQWYG
jgi:hypothetical protein